MTHAAAHLSPTAENSSALRESEERLQLALRAGQSGVWDWDMVHDTTDVSPSYRELFGLPADSPVSYETWLAAVHPEDRARCRAYGESFFKGKETEWRLDFRVVTPQGVRWHQAIGQAYRDADGKPLRFVGVTTDITEKQRVLEALRESEERFRAMADGLPLIVWVHDARGEQQFVNRTFLEYFGVSENEMKGDRWQLLMHPDDAPRYTAEFLSCVRERRPFHAETRVCDAKGEWRHLESWGRPRFSVSGEFLGFVGTSADITERKRLEESMRQVDRRKDEFLAFLGHELRNPLAAISTAMELLRQLLPSDLRLQQIRDTAERQTALLTRLVDDLLDRARISTGKFTLQRTQVSLDDVVTAAVEASKPKITAAGHHLSVEHASERLVVDGDHARLVQIVSNLLNNAARFTFEGGDIRLSLEREGDQAVIRIRDNGIGIASEMLPQVFGMFVQAEQPTTSEPGLGLGLTLAKHLTELHGGSIEAHSGGRGRGSMFTVRLPIIARASLTLAPTSGSSGPSATKRRRRVLIVDDNVDVCGLLSQVIELLGHEVCQAASGAAALERFTEFRPEVVLLDIDLPDMDGYTAAQKLRALDPDGNVLIVATSGFAPNEERARDAGIQRHLVKPINAAQLSELLK